MRGLVMIIMVLDHTRDFMHLTSITQSPTDLATTTPMLFFTRWITHLCAPVFVFLSGTSAYISLQRKDDFTAGRGFLLSRGIWLIFLEFTVINFGLWFDIHFQNFLFNVIAAIGFGFIVLSLLLKLSPKSIGIIGLIIIFCHDLIIRIPFDSNNFLKYFVSPFFLPGVFPLSPHTMFIMGYTPIPWLGIMLIGFGAGKLFELPLEKRKKIFLRMGITALVLFILLQIINIYGDPFPWTKQNNDLYIFLSFINVTKYPPSLSFTLLMLGIMFLILSFMEGIKDKFTNIVEIYGKVPLFYFIIHWFILHPLMFVMVFLQGFKSSDLVFGFNFGRPEGSGVNLWVIYLIWIAVVIALYPVCKWYSVFKQNNRQKKWLSYL